MPRAHRARVPGHVWHITHRCHDRKFLLAAEADRMNWRRWLWEARCRYGLSVLNFVATCNHIHLLVDDANGGESLARGLQLVQGRTAQDFNRRRGRRGAFWQDRYHAVAVEAETHLWHCLVYIDFNMVRAGAVTHPADWRCGGHNEIQRPRSRYRVLDLDRAAALTGCSSVAEFQAVHREQVAALLQLGAMQRDPRWTDAIAVGGEAFTERVRSRLGLSRLKRFTETDDEAFVLRDDCGAYVPKMAPATYS